MRETGTPSASPGRSLRSWETPARVVDTPALRTSPAAEKSSSPIHRTKLEGVSFMLLSPQEMCDFTETIVDTLSFPPEIKSSILERLKPFSDSCPQETREEDAIRDLFASAVKSAAVFHQIGDSWRGPQLSLNKNQYVLLGLLYGAAELVKQDPALINEYINVSSTPDGSSRDLIHKFCQQLSRTKERPSSPLAFLLEREMVDSNTMAQSALLAGILSAPLSLIGEVEKTKGLRRILSEVLDAPPSVPSHFKDIGFSAELTPFQWAFILQVAPELNSLSELRSAGEKAKKFSETLERLLKPEHSAGDDLVRFFAVERHIASTRTISEIDFKRLVEKLPFSINHEGKTVASPNFVTQSNTINWCVDKWSKCWRTAWFAPHFIFVVANSISDKTLYDSRPRIARDIQLLWDAWNKIEHVSDKKEFSDLLPKVLTEIGKRLSPDRFNRSIDFKAMKKMEAKLKKAFIEVHEEKMKALR